MGRAVKGGFVYRFAQVAPHVLDDGRFAKARCINSTRICIEALRHFGVRANAMSVEFMAFNPTFRRLADRHGGIPSDEATMKAWYERGARCLQIDTRPEAFDPNGNSWNGHLVAVAQGFLIDPSAGQFNRPQYGIHTPEVLVTDAPNSFIKGNKPLSCEAPNGAVLSYKARKRDFSYAKLPGFDWPGVNQEAVEQIVALMRNKGGHP